MSQEPAYAKHTITIYARGAAERQGLSEITGKAEAEVGPVLCTSYTVEPIQHGDLPAIAQTFFELEDRRPRTSGEIARKLRDDWYGPRD